MAADDDDVAGAAAVVDALHVARGLQRRGGPPSGTASHVQAAELEVCHVSLGLKCDVVVTDVEEDGDEAGCVG